MFLNPWLGQLLRLKTCHGCLPFILTLDELLISHLNQDILLDPHILIQRLELPLRLVLVSLLLLFLPSANDGVRYDCRSFILLRLLGIILGISAATNSTSHAVNAPFLLSCRFLIDRKLGSLEFQALLVIISSETPHDVFTGRLLHVLFQVMESMLSNVRHPQTRRLPDRALRWLLLAHKHLDSRRFASAIGTNDGNTANLRHCEAHVHDGWLVFSRVLEVNLGHAEDDLAAAFASFHSTWFGECEFHDLVAQLEISLLLRVFVDELRQALTLDTLEGFQLPVLEVDDVRAHFVKEWREVGSA